MYLVGIRDPSLRWIRAIGPVGGVVAAQLDAGWASVDPAALVHPDRERPLHTGGAGCSDKEIEDA